MLFQQIADGKNMSANTFSSSVSDSIHREYYPDGKLRLEVLYKNGKKHGIETQWYDHSKRCPMIEKYFNNGLLDGPVIHYDKNCNKTMIENFKNGIKEGWEIEFHENGNLKAEGYYRKGYLDGMFKVYDKNGKFLYESRGFRGDEKLIDNLEPDTSFTSIFHILRRNTSSKKKYIVMDLTASMYPYARQVNTWMQLQFARDTATHYFIFFNDGDKKKDEMKKIGVTGGIYLCVARKTDDLIRTMKIVINNGNGGDYPENVMEALLMAQKRFPKAEEFVLIADNWAKVRDIQLLPRMKKPVRVILCGVSYGMEINPDYLNIAYKTKGSIHTIEEDIFDLNNLIRNKTLSINGVNYKIMNGKIMAE
jgi:hypothetical protein